jgi:hypothetical protein
MKIECRNCKNDLENEGAIEMRDGTWLCVDCYELLDFKERLQKTGDSDKVIREIVQETLSKKYWKVDKDEG